jgi:hypothetical protein
VRTFIFNFKKEFAPAVESGAKCQTVRATRKDGRVPRVGDLAKGYTGLRTRSTRLLVAGPVIEAGRVLIDFRESTIALNGGRLTASESAEFARADGFASFPQMLSWFRCAHKQDPDYFEGFYAKWRPITSTPQPSEKST